MAKKGQISVCTACHFVGKTKPKGSGGIEFILWIFYLIPGLIYHLWRHSGGNKCPECNSAAMIPAHTPKAQEIISKSERQIEVLKEKTEEEKVADEAREKASQRSNRKIIIMAIILGLLFILTAIGRS